MLEENGYFKDFGPLVAKLLAPQLLGISVAGGILTNNLIGAFKSALIRRNINGIDHLKENKPIVASSGGSVMGLVYLIIVFILLPFISMVEAHGALCSDALLMVTRALSGLLALSCMLFLGFVDDAFGLRWRFKLLMPLIATIPILVVTYITLPLGCVRAPAIMATSGIASSLYYLYIAGSILFSTNSINILAGSNGVEISQTIVILVSMLIWIITDTASHPKNIGCTATGLYFCVPFIFVSAGLLVKNWYPAEIFPGDTYCYMAGMAIAVIATLSNFSHILCMFLIPQIFNFLYSCPQLFKLLPCPRHRMPRFVNSRVHYSVFEYNAEVKPLGKLTLYILEKLYLVKIERNNNNPVSCNNLTLINLILLHFGPMKEPTVAKFIILIQSLSSVFGLFVLYPLLSSILRTANLSKWLTPTDFYNENM